MGLAKGLAVIGATVLFVIVAMALFKPANDLALAVEDDVTEAVWLDQGASNRHAIWQTTNQEPAFGTSSTEYGSGVQNFQGSAQFSDSQFFAEYVCVALQWEGFPVGDNFVQLIRVHNNEGVSAANVMARLILIRDGATENAFLRFQSYNPDTGNPILVATSGALTPNNLYSLCGRAQQNGPSVDLTVFWHDCSTNSGTSATTFGAGTGTINQNVGRVELFSTDQPQDILGTVQRFWIGPGAAPTATTCNVSDPDPVDSAVWQDSEQVASFWDLESNQWVEYEDRSQPLISTVRELVLPTIIVVATVALVILAIRQFTQK